MTLHLNGIGVSRGIAIGKIHLVQRGEPDVFESSIPTDRIEREVTRFRRALKLASSQLRNIRNLIPSGTSQDVAEFIDTHLLMLGDDLLSEAPISIIRERGCNAEWALKLQRDQLVAVFDQIKDPYLRTRRDDVDHVIHRLQRILLKKDSPVTSQDYKLKHHIIVADDLSPADTVLLQHQHVTGFITEVGGPVSHTAILARSLGIPAVVGIRDARNLLIEDEQVIVDGGSGLVLANTDQSLIKFFRRKQRNERQHRQRLVTLRDLPTVTKDGYPILLMANIELAEDIRALKQVGADGVGLYRTEFLYIERDQPASEEEQLQTYRKVSRALRGKPLTIRTLDLGSDKPCGPTDFYTQSPNPSLGLRAIRRCLRDTDGFMPQLRAILRASAYAPVRLMFPMLTNTSELQQAVELLDTAKQELTREKKRFNPNLPVGAMIEVPAAALSAEAFAQKLDFLSIGTNDLIQYTLAIDRLDDEVNYLYDPLHPAVLKLINMVLQAGQKARISVSMCGEMAGDIRYTRLLLGMGLREFSAPPATLLEVKKVILESNVVELEKHCQNIIENEDTDQIVPAVANLNHVGM